MFIHHRLNCINALASCWIRQKTISKACILGRVLKAELYNYVVFIVVFSHMVAK